MFLQQYPSTFIVLNFLFSHFSFVFCRPIITNEIPDLPIHDDIPVPAKTEAMVSEPMEVHTPLVDNNANQIPHRINSKISREYLTQHISYRAHRLASKVEPEMV